MTEPKKDNIYIDVDDEITSIVEKLNNSSSKIVALVLPKRAAVLQSIVNMKLLKRAADESGKRVVLITSEAGILSLAGAVGVYVAKNLQSKPEIPAAPETPEEMDELLEHEEVPTDDEAAVDKDATVGELSDNDDDLFEDAAPTAAGAAVATARAKSKAGKAPKPAKAPKVKKEKTGKVPNFEKFRTKIFLGIGALILLIGLWYLAFVVAPRATVTVTTETSTVNSTIAFTASTTATAVDTEKNVIPAKEVESQKTESQKVPATGQKDLGTKATGSVTLSIPCSSISGSPPQIPAGSGVSTNGLTYITQSTVSLTSPSFSGGCKFTGSTNVTAQSNGDQYNIAAGRTFTVSGFSSVSGTNDAAMSGGTSKMAKVVSQQDIDSAKQKITDGSTTVKDELKKQLEDEGYYALTDTFTTKKETITASPALDQEGTEVTVTAARTYSMVGVKRDDLKVLVEKDVQDEVEERSQQVQDDGIDKAVFRLGEKKTATDTPITMQTQVALGPKIDNEQLKKDIAGKKRGDVENIVKGIDGVTEVDVKYSPFWVSMTPKNTSKITIEYKEAQE